MKRTLALFLGAMLLLSGCTADTETPSQFGTEKVGKGLYVITDSETDVQYLYVDSGYSGGLTKLEPVPTPEPTPIPEPTPTPEPEPEPVVKSLGEFVVTAYCACKKCCGKDPDHPAYGITSSGTTATQGRTIAVDTNVIPYGTEVMFLGPDGTMHTYIAEDTGSSIDENRIDLFFDDHEEALVWGVQVREVFVNEGL